MDRFILESLSIVGRAVHRLANRISQSVPTGPANEEGKPKTIAIISGAEPITYNTMIFACMRAGFEPFPLSSRNSAAGLKHLIVSMDVHHVLGSVSQDRNASSALQHTTAEVLSELENTQYALHLIEEPHFWELFPRLASSPYPPYDRAADIKATGLMPPLNELASFRNADLKGWPAIILHSSGSTGFPKPIRADQRMFRHWLDWPWHGYSDIAGTVFAAHGVPSFHLGGVVFTLGPPITCGAIVANFKPSEPAQVVNAQSSLQALRKADTEWFMAVPMFLEMWAHEPQSVQFLASRKAVLFGSAPLSYEIGERLVKLGVNLVNIYGSTETGLVTALTTTRGRSWLYTEIASFCKCRLERDDDDSQNIYRLVFEECDDYSPSEFNVPGQRAYDMHDLVTPHPTIKHQFRILGRSDDQIIHSTGEKTNPGPLENLVLGSPLVKSAVYFGTECPQAGVIIEPTEPVDLDNLDAIAAYRNAIWPYIERANKQAPACSRVFKEYILIADIVNKPLARTAKASIARKLVLRDYEAEIHKIYYTIEQYNDSEWARPPSIWNQESIRLFVLKVVQGTMRGESDENIDEDRDVFEQGCDSLQATVIRNSIINALSKHRVTTENFVFSGNPLEVIPQNLVYAHPSIVRLSAFIFTLVHPGDYEVGRASSSSDRVSNMLSLVEKYSADFPTLGLRASSVPQDGESVLVTGTTGTLGTYILEALINAPEVKKIFALNRSSKAASLLDRQQTSLIDRGLDPKLALHGKVALLEGDVSQPQLGLPDAVYEEIRTALTSIIHAAWPLNFNLQVSSFEPYIAGSRNLINLALTSVKEVEFLFTSSLGSVANWQSERPVPETFCDVDVAIGTGYGESKWVVDQILFKVSQQRGLSTTSFRVGQLVGSTVNGAWNVTDWVPRIVQTGARMRKLPLVDETHTISWLPVDAAAATIVEVLLQPARGSRVLSIAHSTPSRWNVVMRQMGDCLSASGPCIQYLPCDVWLRELESLSSIPSAVSEYSALLLLDFLRSCISKELRQHDEAMGMPKVQTSEVRKVSRTIDEISGLTKEDVERWMSYWTRRGLFGEPLETHSVQ